MSETNSSYDESQSYFSPGRMLLYKLLEDQFAKKHVKTIEFYTNAKMNNLEWGTHASWINHHLLFRNKFISSAYKEMKQLNDRLRSRS